MASTPHAVKDILIAALAITDPPGRAAYLAEACGGDDELRQRVESLIRASEHPDSFLDDTSGNPPPAEIPSTRSHNRSPLDAADHAGVDEVAGTLIGGRYKLIETIGKGGMGLVWIAQQAEPVKRLVAVKIMKSGTDSRQVLARFEAERQALALMDHPNIARVYDAGAMPDGRPYFVMELVKGVPITKFCDERHLTPRQRLELFVPVCLAIQHIHQKGVIHCDIKPSNVMVALYDDRPVPKVIDFAFAKAMGPQLTDRTQVAGFGTPVVTPEYMSPEQANFNQMDVDTRSDVYALGVLLYELLTGTTPVDRESLGKAAAPEILRIVREVEPLRPSAKLIQSDALPSVAANRNVEPARLCRLMQRELDWVVMKALAKDRARRYVTANALARDIQRYLADEFVEARPPSTGYRLRKFIRRNRVSVLAGAVVLAVLIGGMSATTAAMLEAQRQKDQAIEARDEKEIALVAEAAEHKRAVEQFKLAEEQKKKATEARDEAVAINDLIFGSLLTQADVDRQLYDDAEVRDPNLKVRTLLDRTAKEIGGKFANRPTTEAKMRHVIGEAYLSLGEYAAAQLHLERALDLFRIHFGDSNENTLLATNTLIRLYMVQKKYDKAEQLLLAAFEIRKATNGDNHAATLFVQSMLALNYQCQGKYETAEQLFLQVIKSQTAALGADHAATLFSKHNLAALYRLENRLGEAETLQRAVVEGRAAALGADHPSTLLSKNNLAGIYAEQGRVDEADALMRDVVDKRLVVLCANHPATMNSMRILAGSYMNRGKLDEAEPILRTLVEAQQARFGAEDAATMNSKRQLISIYLAREQFDKAEPLYLETLSANRNRFGLADPETRTCFRAVISFYDLHLGQPERAEPFIREVAEFEKRTHGRDSLQYTAELTSLCLNLLKQKRWEEAETDTRICLAICDTLATQAKPPLPWAVANLKSILGGALAGQKKFSEAEPLLLLGYQGMKENEVALPLQAKVRLSEAVDRLAELYTDWGKADEAAKWRVERAIYPLEQAPRPRAVQK